MALAISRNSPVPLHRQLRDILEQQIRDGVWAPHQMIPTESELMERYGLSRTTVRQALAALVADGLLYRQQGKGTFVAPPRIAQPLDQLVGFAEILLQQGLEPDIHVLGVRQEPAPPEVAGHLDLAAGAPVVAVARRVDVDGEPLFWDRSYWPAHLGEPAPADLAGRPVLRWLEDRGLHLAEAALTLAARGATAEEAAILRLPRGSPVMAIDRTVYAAGGQPVLYSAVVYRSDRYQFQIRLERKVRAAAGREVLV